MYREYVNYYDNLIEIFWLKIHYFALFHCSIRTFLHLIIV